jgi:fructuronate reductase
MLRPAGSMPGAIVTASGPRLRLNASTLAGVGGARLPDYDRSRVPAIVHLGVGAFARAHLGVYADDLLRSGWPATVHGVSLRTHRAEDQLGPQDGLYTVTEREPGTDPAVRVVGALTAVSTGAAAAVDAIAAPTTRLVTLTVTEKGYDLGIDGPQSVPGVLALALARRRASEAAPPVFASLDNLEDNGTLLRDRVLEAAERLEPGLSRWIAEEVRFPRSVVDRMVPATAEADIDDVGRRLWVVDLAAVTCEAHRSWVVDAVKGLPPLADVGVDVVPDVGPYQRRKLWLLNGAHSALAYCGLLAGCATIAEAAEHPLVAPFVRQLVDDVLAVLDVPAGLEPATFAADALHRFRNPDLGHACVQVGADGSRKLPERLLPVVGARRRRGLDTRRFAVVVAAWIAPAAGIAVQGSVLPAVDDPLADALRAAAAGGTDLHRVADAALYRRWDQSFVFEVVAALRQLIREGITAVAALTTGERR